MMSQSGRVDHQPMSQEMRAEIPWVRWLGCAVGPMVENSATHATPPLEALALDWRGDVRPARGNFAGVPAVAAAQVEAVARPTRGKDDATSVMQIEAMECLGYCSGVGEDSDQDHERGTAFVRPKARFPLFPS